jgi:CTP synthase
MPAAPSMTTEPISPTQPSHHHMTPPPTFPIEVDPVHVPVLMGSTKPGSTSDVAAELFRGHRPSDLVGLSAGAAESEFYSPFPDGYQRGSHKYVIVLGTVMSGLGKGIFSSSLAKMLKDKGLTVAPIKMEGYLNMDSGTLNPYRHGEVFVLEDGTECDMDLGTYERLLDQNLSKANFTTSGQIFSEILRRERQGAYLGRDVQWIPHVTGEVKRKLRELALRGDGSSPADVVFVEVGGTVGDYENGFYIEAMRELAFEEGPGNVCFVALTYVIEPPALGEQKSKAAQLGIGRLMEAGVQPHIIACRASNPVGEKVREKIAMFSNVPMRRVFSMHDRESIYTIPEEMRTEGLDREILSLLNLHDRCDFSQEDKHREKWNVFTRRLTSTKQRQIHLGVAGKYAHLRDAYASIDKALEHCSANLGVTIDAQWIETSDISDANVARTLSGLDAVIVPGGFGSRGVEGKIACVRHCREQQVPYLGICLGFQVAVIEFARNVLGMSDADSTEFNSQTKCPVISELPEQKRVEGLGGSMRLGGQDVLISPATLASFLYGGRASIRERFRHRYEVDPQFIAQLEAAGLIFSGRHPSRPIMQVLELPRPGQMKAGDVVGAAGAGKATGVTHPFFVGAQFHPELTSRPLRPQPLFMGLVAAAMHRKDDSSIDDRDPWAADLKRWIAPASIATAEKRRPQTV